MPRKHSSTKVRATSTDDATHNDDSGDNTVTAATDTTNTTDATDDEQASVAPSFSFTVESAPSDYEPDRKNPGRTRTPSFFDGPILQLKDQGWQRTPFQGAEMRAAILRELAKAKQFHNLGLDLNVTDTHVEWKSRDLQKRRPRRKKGDAQANGNGSAALDANAEANGDLDPDGDNDE